MKLLLKPNLYVYVSLVLHLELVSAPAILTQDEVKNNDTFKYQLPSGKSDHFISSFSILLCVIIRVCLQG